MAARLAYIRLLYLLAIFFSVQCSNPKQQENSSFDYTHGKDSCCNNEKTCVEKNSAKISLQSEITCPKCGYKKIEFLPTDVCLLSYTCKNCQTILHPKTGDCCIFCTYGSHKCPSKQ